MKLLKILGAALASALLLAGCSGSNTLSGAGGGGGGGSGGVATVTVSANPGTVSTDGTATSTITAIARDANNVAVAGGTVTFAATAGLLSGVGTTTDSSGSATATLSGQGLSAGTAISVTATVNGVKSSTITVNVVANQQTISLTTDAPQIASDGSTTATISALLRDANNVALPGVTVTFSADSGVLTPTQPVTDSTGTAKATLTAGNDPTNRTITVTAAAGTATPATLPINVTGTSLALTGPANLVLGSQGSYTVLLTNSSGRGIAGKTVTVASANGNTVAPASLTTDANGQGVVKVTATSTANGGADTLSASGLGLIATRAITVTAQSFNITTPVPVPPATSTQVNLGVAQTITATWLSGGAPVVGQTVNFASTRGTLSAASALTDATGNATVTVSSTTAGAAVVSASGNGVGAQTNIDFVATTPSQIAVQPNPASVAVQATSSITATVRDAQNNLVEGATVTFSLQDSTGGQLSVASATTDSQGRAQTTYTAGSTSSAANGVVVTATVQGTSISAQTFLTVGGQTVFLSLGTGNTIESPTQATYDIQYAVLALDSQGAAVSGVPVTLSVLPLAYVKGYRYWNGTTWATQSVTAGGDVHAYQAKPMCTNEDTDYTGNIASLDPTGPLGTCTDLASSQVITAHAKDYNCSGALEPGNVAAVTPSSAKTDATGQVLVTVTYPKDHAYYVLVQLVATTSVTGTQSSTSSTFLLPGAAGDFNTQTVQPPGPVSPYGQATTCADPR
ncbi:MAG: Ig-like domain-containing protein [Proteobacteria bacterium]|nr:Ig-like domain-containing protein [Pseudomonadota bacterium]